MELTPIIIDDKTFFLSEELYNIAPIFFKGCARNKRDIIGKLDLDKSVYIFGNTLSGVWKLSRKENRRAKLLITKEWSCANVPGLKEVPSEEEAPSEEEVEEVPHKKESKVLQDRAKKYKPAPPVVELKDSEKFTDAEGNFQDIEVRGTSRSKEDIYFRVKDIEKHFGISKLQNSIVNNYYSDFDDCHTTFCVKQKNVRDGTSSAEQTRNEMFLSFRGLLSVIFRNRTPKTSHYYDWAANILYSAQFGTKEEKEEVVSNILGVSHTDLLKLYSSNSKLPCVYLNDIGDVDIVKSKDKFSGCSFDDFKGDDRVYKFGFTNDYLTRMKSEKIKEHKGLCIKYILNRYVDVNYKVDAENFIRQQTVLSKSKLPGLNDYFVLESTDTQSFKDVVSVFDNCTKIYSRSTDELNRKIIEMENIINTERLEHKLELGKERHEKEISEEKYKNDVIEERHKREISEERCKAVEEKRLDQEKYYKQVIETEELKRQLLEIKLESK